MAPFVINHPVLLNNWITARETALARVRALPSASSEEVDRFRKMFLRACFNVDIWRSEHPIQLEKLARLKSDLARLEEHIANDVFSVEQPWNKLYEWAETNLSLEGQEKLVSLMLEPYGEIVDDLVFEMGADEAAAFSIDGAMKISQLRTITEDVYSWALDIDWRSTDAISRVWYVSEEKLEPRLGQRFDEPIEPYEQPLATGRDVSAMHRDLMAWDGTETVAAFLLAHPEHRHIVRRVQVAGQYPYAEIRDNTIGSELLPIDMLRCKLSYFGATHFDPRSDRWVRINMFKNAPFPGDLGGEDADDWSYPVRPDTSA